MLTYILLQVPYLMSMLSGSCLRRDMGAMAR